MTSFQRLGDTLEKRFFGIVPEGKIVSRIRTFRPKSTPLDMTISGIVENLAFYYPDEDENVRREMVDVIRDMKNLVYMNSKYVAAVISYRNVAATVRIDNQNIPRFRLQSGFFDTPAWKIIYRGLKKSTEGKPLPGSKYKEQVYAYSVKIGLYMEAREKERIRIAESGTAFFDISTFQR